MDITTPPCPPPKKHSAKKADRAPDYLDFYKEDDNGHYWFQRENFKKKFEEKPAACRNLIQRTIFDYGAYMLERDNINIEEIKKYISAANEYLKD